MIDKDLLDILACPETHQPLAMAEPALLAKINKLISGGSCTNAGGKKVVDPLDAGLVREDGKVLYPIRDDIPVLLIDEGLKVD